MDAKHWEQVKSLFERAIALPASERRSFLDRACGNADPGLRREVEELLRGDRIAEADGRLSDPVLRWEDQTLKAASQTEYIGPYRVLKKLPPGGMGEIYLASDDKLKRKVIIKLLPSDAPPENVRRFEEEQRILAQLNHQNIIAIYGTATLEGDGRCYFVMEFVEGEDLKTYMRRVGRLPLSDVVAITRQVAAALDAAHARGIVHRDIKPANIMAMCDGEGWRVKVLDFGISVRQKSEGETTRDIRWGTGPRDYTEGVIGTPAYLSPEQAAGLRRDQIDGRADTYSLGVVVYELLTGRRPFYSKDPDVLLQQHIDKLPVPPSKADQSLVLPARLDSAVLRALEKKPADRFETAGAFAEALVECVVSSPHPLATSPTTSLTISPTTGLTTRKMLVLTATVLLVLCVMIAYQFLRARGDEGTATSVANPEPSSENAADKPIGETPDMLSMALFRVGRDGRRQQVNTDYTFRSGDGMRLSVTPLRDGYLYLIQAGSSGKVQILYPDRRIDRGNHQVNAGQRLEIPTAASQYYRFDNRTGNETLYLIHTSKKGNPALSEIEAALGRKGNQPAAAVLDKLNRLAESRENRASEVVVRLLKLQHTRMGED